MSDSSFKPLKAGLIRVFAYSFIAAFIMIVFSLEARYHKGPHLYSEASITETLQLVLLALTTICLVLCGRKNKNSYAMTTIMAGMTSIAFIRENDALLDNNLFDGAWQTGAVIALIITFMLVYRKKDQLLPSINAFMKRPSFGYFVCGFITVFVYSRLFGRGVLWNDIMGPENMMRAVKNAAEEGTELFGYAVLFIASIELYIESLFISRSEN